MRYHVEITTRRGRWTGRDQEWETWIDASSEADALTLALAYNGITIRVTRRPDLEDGQRRTLTDYRDLEGEFAPPRRADHEPRESRR